MSFEIFFVHTITLQRNFCIRSQMWIRLQHILSKFIQSVNQGFIILILFKFDVFKTIQFVFIIGFQDFNSQIRSDWIIIEILVDQINHNCFTLLNCSFLLITHFPISKLLVKRKNQSFCLFNSNLHK